MAALAASAAAERPSATLFLRDMFFSWLVSCCAVGDGRFMHPRWVLPSIHAQLL
jgi:hypothetical protein